MNPTQYCTTSQVAIRGGVSTATVLLWHRTGRLKAVRLSNGTRLFLRRDVDRVIAHRALKARGRKARA